MSVASPSSGCRSLCETEQEAEFAVFAVSLFFLLVCFDRLRRGPPAGARSSRPGRRGLAWKALGGGTGDGRRENKVPRLWHLAEAESGEESKGTCCPCPVWRPKQKWPQSCPLTKHEALSLSAFPRIPKPDLGLRRKIQTCDETTRPTLLSSTHHRLGKVRTPRAESELDLGWEGGVEALGASRTGRDTQKMRCCFLNSDDITHRTWP